MGIDMQTVKAALLIVVGGLIAIGCIAAMFTWRTIKRQEKMLQELEQAGLLPWGTKKQ